MAEMHPSMARLYRAAAPAGVTTQAELARELNTSSQRINNWEARGISQQGAIEAERAFGISPLWVLEGIERGTTARLPTDLSTAAAHSVRLDSDRLALALAVVDGALRLNGQQLEEKRKAQVVAHIYGGPYDLTGDPGAVVRALLTGIIEFSEAP